ncbi:MAG: transposase [Pyrinomonadaceae bacterium]
MAKWNDTDVPLAFLITFRTHGTWLHGDERGSIDRHNNKFGSPRIPRKVAWQDHNRKSLKQPPVTLDAARRRAVEEAIRGVCRHRGWRLLAINVRTNHVHVVVAIGASLPDRALNSFKAYATRMMRESGIWDSELSPWVGKGSCRWLWNEESIANACDYVESGQGEDLRELDDWKR